MSALLIHQSPRLAKWLKKNGMTQGKAQVFRNADGLLFVGRKDGGLMVGQRLAPIVFGHYGTGKRYAYSSKGFTELKSFWRRYEKIGVCALDPAHRFAVMDGVLRFKLPEETSRRRVVVCACCGAKLRLKVKVVKNRYLTWTVERPSTHTTKRGFGPRKSDAAQGVPTSAYDGKGGAEV